MNELQLVGDIFATLHDGVIEEYSGAYDELTLKVNCDYLANLIDASFSYFYLILKDVKEFRFEAFPNMASKEITILYTKIEGDSLKVECTIGDLYVQCKSITVYDEQKRQLLPTKLFELAQRYWDDLSKTLETSLSRDL